jgi:pimeloyl-ACP methyl ester carboxylesterase
MPREIEPPARENWFLIRGLLRETGHWGDFPEAFRQHFRHARVYCLDLPGNGRYWRLSTPLSVAAMAAFLHRQFLKILEIQKKHGYAGLPNYLLSISLGSMVSLEWMSHHPEALSGAVFINTSLRGLTPPYRRLRPKALVHLACLLGVTDAQKRERRILELTSNKGDWAPGTLARWAGLYARHPVRRANFFRQLVAALRYRPPVEKPTVPILLLNSENDRMVHPRCSLDLQSHWNLSLKTNPWAGHDLPLDDPKWTLQSVDGWLSGLSTRDA